MKLKTTYKIWLLYIQAWLVGLIVPVVMGLITEPETPFHIGLFLLTSLGIGCLYGIMTANWIHKVDKELKENNENK